MNAGYINNINNKMIPVFPTARDYLIRPRYRRSASLCFKVSLFRYITISHPTTGLNYDIIPEYVFITFHGFVSGPKLQTFLTLKVLVTTIDALGHL